MAQSFRTAISFDGLASASSQAISIKVDGDSQNRVLIDAGGKITWGAGGSSAGDTTLYRNAANVLKTDDGFVAASVTVPDGGLTLGSTAVTSTAAELNILDGVTATASELNILDGVTSTTSELNILDGVTSTASELNLVDGITAGTVSASKAVIADSNKDVTGFRNVTATGIVDAVNFKVNGGQGSDGQVLTSTGSGVAWENASGGGGSTDPAGSDHDVQFNNSGSFGADSNFTYDGSTVNIKAALNVGVNDTGHDVIFYGATATNAWFWWDESTDNLLLGPSTKLGIGTETPSDSLHVSGTLDFQVNPGSNELVKLIGNTNSARPYMAFYNQDSAGNLDRKGYIGYPQAASDSSRIYIRSDQGLIDMSETTMTKLTLTDTTDTGSDTSDGALTIGATSSNHLSFDTNEIISKSNDSTMATLHLQTDGGSTKFGNNTELTLFKICASQTQIYSTANALELHNTTSGDQSVYHSYYNDSGTRYGYMGYPANDDMYFKNENSGGQMYSFSPGSYMYWHVAGAYELRLSASELRPYSNEGLNLGASGAAWNHFYLGQANTFSSGGYYTLRSRDSDRQVMELVSSERYKKDIVDLPLSEAYQVLDSRVIKYRGVDDDSSVPLEVGLSAESLHNAGYEYAVRYDEGHWGETPRSIYYEYLTAPLIKICQDQKDRIESLEAKVAALEAA